MPTTLVAVSGMSPAVITETVWALAHETPPVVPDDVVVVTTVVGEAEIQEQLQTPRQTWHNQTVWHALRSAIFTRLKMPGKSSKLQLSIRVIDLPDEETGIRQKARDIRTGADSAQAADFIVRTIAPIADATDQHLIASIAGGRKTMGALLYAAMNLLGKESDRVTHVLVSEPFENSRNFFYPAQPDQNVVFNVRDGSVISRKASTARIEMADIPFVPLRNGFAALNTGRRTFSGLVTHYSSDLRRLGDQKPRARIDPATGCFYIEDNCISLSGRTLLVSAFLLERARRSQPLYDNAPAAESDYLDFFLSWKKEQRHAHLLSRYYDGQTPDFEDITKALSDLRQKLTASGSARYLPYLAPKRSRIGFDVAAFK